MYYRAIATYSAVFSSLMAVYAAHLNDPKALFVFAIAAGLAAAIREVTE